MLQRRRTTAMSFRPPKQVTVQEGESGIVEMDEAGFLQLLTDFKSLKTQLLKLKRELQEVRSSKKIWVFLFNHKQQQRVNSDNSARSS